MNTNPSKNIITVLLSAILVFAAIGVTLLAAPYLGVVNLKEAKPIQSSPASSINAQTALSKALAASVVKAELVKPPFVPTPLARTEPTTVMVELTTKELRRALSDGVEYEFWTFDGTVPGPFIRVRAGDLVEFHVKNGASSKNPHSIDLHAVTGPGGGARLTQTQPGGQTAFQWLALNPGLYVYHCATPIIPVHVANGMYGLILVEPDKGLPKVDREYYVMQGDFYTVGKTGDTGFQAFSAEKMLREDADYVVFNGGTTALTGENALKAKVGETVRIYFGVGGPNKVSSFHVIGEIFDRVYVEGASEYISNVQTTLVPAGGATIVDFKVEVPGQYILVDHSLSRVAKGAAGFLVVEGQETRGLYSHVGPTSSSSTSSASH